MASSDHQDAVNLKNMVKLYMPICSFSLAQSHFYFLLPFTAVFYIRRHCYTSHCIQSSIILNHFTTTEYALSNLRLCLCKPFTTIDLCNIINSSYVYSGATKPTLQYYCLCNQCSQFHIAIWFICRYPAGYNQLSTSHVQVAFSRILCSLKFSRTGGFMGC